MCKFDNSSFTSCNLISPNFYDCNFSPWSIFSGSITNAIFNYIGAGGVIFKSSNLNGSKFYGWFQSADFSSCDLRNCEFYKCNLVGANFDNSDLRASTFKEVQFEGDDPMSNLDEMQLKIQPLGERDTLVAKIDLKTGHSAPSDTIGGLSASIKYNAGKKMFATFKRAKMGNVKWIDGRIFRSDSIGK
ncbi:MAG: pentapeptide repeat-containing protein [Lacibacter sp.]